MSDWVLPAGFAGNPAVYVIVAFAALMMTGISKGGFGGIGSLSIPLMMMVAPAPFSLGLWLPLLVLCDILTLRHYPKEWRLRPLAVLAPWMLLGIVCGSLLLGRISPPTIKILVGAASLLFVGLDGVRAWLKWRIEHEKDSPPFRPTLITAAPFGMVAGISTVIAHAAGAIVTIYFLPQRLNKRDFVGTQARIFFIVNVLKIPFYLHQDLITVNTLRRSLWMVPLAPLGVWLGATLNEKMSPVLFHRVVYILLAISGAYLVFANIG